MYSNLTDEAFFNVFCTSIDITYGSGDNEMVIVKDKNFSHRYISPGFIGEFHPGTNIKLEDILGKISYMAKKDKKSLMLEEEFNKHDELIKNTLSPHYFLYVDFNNKPYIVRRRPIINPNTGNFIGILISFRVFLLPHIIKLIYKIHGVDFGMANSFQKENLVYKLTLRQHMVLFLYINKYSNTEISAIMGTLGHKISAGRVNDHLENLKYIFGVRAKEQLIEKAISLQYHTFLPRQFLKVGIYPLDDKALVSEI